MRASTVVAQKVVELPGCCLSRTRIWAEQVGDVVALALDGLLSLAKVAKIGLRCGSGSCGCLCGSVLLATAAEKSTEAAKRAGMINVRGASEPNAPAASKQDDYNAILRKHGLI